MLSKLLVSKYTELMAPWLDMIGSRKKVPFGVLGFRV